MSRASLIVLVLGGVLCTAPVQVSAQGTPPTAAVAPLPSVELPAELARVLRDYERLWKAGDATGLAALFTEDGMALQNGRSPSRGRAAIAQGYGIPGGDLRLRAMAYAVGDTVGYIIGGYRYSEGADDQGKFVLAVRRSPGQPWLIAADMDNANRRAGPP